MAILGSPTEQNQAKCGASIEISFRPTATLDGPNLGLVRTGCFLDTLFFVKEIPANQQASCRCLTSPIFSGDMSSSLAQRGLARHIFGAWGTAFLL